MTLYKVDYLTDTNLEDLEPGDIIDCKKGYTNDPSFTGRGPVTYKIISPEKPDDLIIKGK